MERETLDISEVQQWLSAFADKRDWNQYHSPKNLVMALAGEVGELVELFQWLSEADSMQFGDVLDRRSVEDELADTLQYVIRIADRLDVDLVESLWRKLGENETRYKPDVVRGRALKMPSEE